MEVGIGSVLAPLCSCDVQELLEWVVWTRWVAEALRDWTGDGSAVFNGGFLCYLLEVESGQGGCDDCGAKYCQLRSFIAA
jgi:hypothetical protein